MSVHKPSHAVLLDSCRVIQVCSRPLGQRMRTLRGMFTNHAKGGNIEITGKFAEFVCAR